jgi:hypothetical protein
MAMNHQVAEDIVTGGSTDHRAGRYSQLDVGPAGAGLVRAPPVLTSFGLYQTPIVEVEEGVETFVDNEDHASTAPTIAAVRPTPWYEFFPSE